MFCRLTLKLINQQVNSWELFYILIFCFTLLFVIFWFILLHLYVISLHLFTVAM